MLTRGAVIREVPGELEVVDLEVEDPRPDEVQVQMVASGMCHSDDHHCTGDIPVGTYPFALGHEGAGIVTKAFENDKGIKEGDHVVFAAIPSCGTCRWCATGMSSLCDMAAGILAGPRFTDGTYRVHTTDGTPVGQMCGISTFMEHTTVALASVVKIPDDIPLDKACLVGCGVSTGWGSSVNLGGVQPGATVIVMGIGGIGSAALQGARHAGAMHIVAVDPVEFKRAEAKKFGATQSFANMAEAADFARSVTNGQGADATIITVGVVQPKHIAEGFASIRKAGTVVVTSVGDQRDVGVPVSLHELTLSQKRIQGAVFGSTNGKWDVQRLLQMYQAGQLNLDDMITQTYSLDEIAQGYRDLKAGKNIRGVITYG